MRKTLIACALLALLVTLATNTQLPGTLGREASRSDVPTLAFPAAAPALIGAWDRQSEASPALRVVVKAVHASWADVVVAWGDASGGRGFTHRMRTRARVLENGGIYVPEPLRMAFVLSEDRAVLVGVRTAYDPLSSVLLRRTAADERAPALLPLPESR